VKAGASVVVVRRRSRSTAKTCLEHGHSCVGFEFGAPAAPAGGEEAPFLDDSVATSDGAGGSDRVVSGFGEHHSVFKLGEYRFKGSVV
jgi:hypothetical protein